MKTATLIGCLLIIFGIGVLAYQGFSYSAREEIVDLGPVEVTAETTRTLPVPPLVGVLALFGGAALLFARTRSGAAAI